MKKTVNEYWVEYDWKEDGNGKNFPMWIKCCKTREEAEAFAETTTDGVVVELTLMNI